MERTNIGTFEKINYSLRPAKNIERKMMFEIFSRLSIIDHLSNYRYVGFGSAYFTDFILAHKKLGINHLISIEKDVEEVNDRILFNKPYSCVEVIFGDSKTILPSLDWTENKNVLWLDYDKRLNLDMFIDIDTFFSKSLPWSMFAISINIEAYQKPESYKKSQKEFRQQQVEKNMGKSRIPPQYATVNLNTVEYRNLVQDVIENEISKSLGIRNGGLQKDEKLQYKQLFNFIYSDGALMLTMGGILYPEKEASELNKMGFHNLSYISNCTNPFEIVVPNLTYKEIRALDNLLPENVDIETGDINKTGIDFIPFPVLKSHDIINYAKVYRFFPNFGELTQ